MGITYFSGLFSSLPSLPAPGQWHCSGFRPGERPLQSSVDIGQSCPAEPSDLGGFAANQPQTCSSSGAVVQMSDGKSGQSACGDHHWIGSLWRLLRGAWIPDFPELCEARFSSVCVFPRPNCDAAVPVLPMEALSSDPRVIRPARRTPNSSQS